MLGSALDIRRTESRRVILSDQSGARATSAKLVMVASVVLLASLALLILLSPLMVDPAVMPGRRYASPEERASAFAEISGSLLDRYAEAGDRAGSARGAVGDTRPQTSTGIDAVPPPPPPPIAPLPDLPAADPPIPVSTTTVDPRQPEGEERTAWLDPSPKGSDADPPAVSTRSQPTSPVPRVFVHFSNRASAGRQRAIEVAQALEEQGYVVADIREVAFAIAFPKVRYFFPADRPGAERLAWEARAMSEDAPSPPVRVQDYTHFRPLPTPGNVEIWLASERPRREG